MLPLSNLTSPFCFIYISYEVIFAVTATYFCARSRAADGVILVQKALMKKRKKKKKKKSHTPKVAFSSSYVPSFIADSEPSGSTKHRT